MNFSRFFLKLTLFFGIYMCVGISKPIFSQELNKKSILGEKVEELIIKSNHKTLVKAHHYLKENKFDSCYVYCEKGLSLISQQKEKDILNCMQGISAYKKGLLKKAITNFLSISDDKLLKDFKFSYLGAVFFARKEYDEALRYYLLWEKNNNSSKTHKKNMYHNIGILYTHIKQFNKAESYFLKAFEQISKKDTLAIIGEKNDLANVYYGQYLDEKAIPLFKEAYALAKQFSNIELKRRTAKNMAVVEKNRKNYKESIKYYQEHIMWRDSIWNRDKVWELTKKEKEIAVAQKQQKIIVQQEELKRQRIVQQGLLLGASSLLIFLVGLTYFYRKLRKQKEFILKQKEALSIANKTKNYLFSVVSHDLRSPINTIKRQHQKLAQHIANNDLPAIKETTQSAISVTESTSHLLNNVLHWALEQSNQLNFSLEEYVLHKIIEPVLFDYKDLATSKGISISFEFENVIIVKVDKESLKIVLRNLLDNSIKYMKGNGSITIKVSLPSENKARIEIKDTGIGISKEKLRKINNLKDLSIDKIDRSKGVGLGLLLCQTLIKKNNGVLFFESEENKGTSAIILLPTF